MAKKVVIDRATVENVLTRDKRGDGAAWIAAEVGLSLSATREILHAHRRTRADAAIVKRAKANVKRRLKGSGPKAARKKAAARRPAGKAAARRPAGKAAGTRR